MIETVDSARPKIRIEGLYKIFGRHPDRARKMLAAGTGKDDILAETGQAVGVVDATFEVYEGETVVVMGLSGSGKSTLLRCVNRLIEPTYGKVFIDGDDITALTIPEMREVRKTKFGMVFQSFALFPHRTVTENVAFGLEIRKVAKEDRLERAERALESVGLLGWGSSYPATLSGGMKQRVGLARALAVDPDILLMDEAFSALDPLIRSDMQDELLALERKVKKTILFITHDLDEALKMGDRIVLMKDGEVVQIGTSEEILSTPANEYVRRFVENVDRTKVLIAEDVMIRADPVVFRRDGPRVALHRMREAGHSGIFVVTQDHTLVGYLTADRALQAVSDGEKSLEAIVEPYDESVVSRSTPVREIFAAGIDGAWPIAVVNGERRLVGVLVKGVLLGALAEQGGTGESA